MFYVHALGAKTVLGLQYKVVPLGPDSMVHLKNLTFFFFGCFSWWSGSYKI